MSDQATGWKAVVIVDKNGNPVDDITLVSNIGEETDIVSVPYNFGINTILAHLNTNYYHIHGQSFTYPKLGNSVNVVAGSGIWNNTGAITEIIPAGALNVADYDLHWINIYTISANGEGLVQIYAGEIGSEVEIGSTKFNRNAVQSQEGPKRIQVPQQLVGTRISCRISDSTAGALNVNISFEGHYYE
jgi:hypothetical protein